METIIATDEIIVKTTGRNYDFIATVENKTDEKIKIVFDKDEDYYIEIEPKDWLGLLADSEGWDMLECFKTGNFCLKSS